MKQCKLQNSPIIYYISGNDHDEWCLFLHAAFVNHKMYRTQIEYFRDKYNVLVIDIIGHGQSTDTKKGDSMDKMSVWIHDIMVTEGIEKMHIIGVSLGAVLAQDFANQYPDAIKSLACFGGYNINNFHGGIKKGNGAVQMLMIVKAFVSVKWFAKANKKISAFTLQAQNEFYDMNVQFPKKSFMYLASLNRMINTHETVKRKYPFLIGCGEFDSPMESAAIEIWKKQEPQVNVIIFEKAGHCVNMDIPEKFNKTIEKFWKDARYCP